MNMVYGVKTKKIYRFFQENFAGEDHDLLHQQAIPLTKNVTASDNIWLTREVLEEEAVKSFFGSVL